MTQLFLKSVLEYSPKTGIFTWLEPRGGARAGDRAGAKHNNGYIVIRINKKQYQAHRLAWIYVNGGIGDDCEIDHINHIRSDNRLNNIREVNRIDNMKNKSLQSNNSSGHIGVTFNKRSKRWKAQIQVDKKCIYLGYFDNLEDATYARVSAEIEYGFHRNHGKVELEQNSNPYCPSLFD